MTTTLPEFPGNLPHRQAWPDFLENIKDYLVGASPQQYGLLGYALTFEQWSAETGSADAFRPVPPSGEEPSHSPATQWTIVTTTKPNRGDSKMP